MRWAIAVALLASGCSGEGDGRRSIVASVYPLAWAAEQIAGPDWEVVDLTPPGAEAHDLDLTLKQRSQIAEAEVVLYLGDIGFQPQVEEAVGDADGTVIALADPLVPVEASEGLDPHLWLSPDAMRTTASLIANEISAPTAATTELRRRLERLEARYRDALSLTECRYRTAIVTHEAFEYMIGRYGFAQLGLSGLAPEAEPSVDRLARARELIDDGRAGAVFYEEDPEARELAETFAGDTGVPALPLNTLESRPAEGDYISVMERNLGSLREGLGCD